MDMWPFTLEVIRSANVYWRLHVANFHSVGFSFNIAVYLCANGGQPLQDGSSNAHDSESWSATTSSSGIFVLLKPFCSLVFELEGGKLDKVLRPDVAALEMLADIHKPIINVCCLDTIAEGLWFVSEELVECSKLILIVVMALVVLLQNLHDQLRVCIGSGHHSLPCLRRWRWWWIRIRSRARWRSHPEEGDIH